MFPNVTLQKTKNKPRQVYFFKQTEDKNISSCERSTLDKSSKNSQNAFQPITLTGHQVVLDHNIISTCVTPRSDFISPTLRSEEIACGAKKEL